MENMWATPDPKQCPCYGSGWAEVDSHVWKECPIHFKGQLHPDSLAFLVDYPEQLVEEEEKARLTYQIHQARSAITDLQQRLSEEHNNLNKMELKLINRTVTIKSMRAVKPDQKESEVVIDENGIVYLDGDFI